MKKYILIPMVFTVIFFMQGCYTVIWTPDVPMPDNYETNNYYYDNDYYITYYEYPWWVNVAQIYNTDVAPITKERIQHDRSGVRNPDGGRNPASGRLPILTTDPAAIGTGSTVTPPSNRDTERRPTVEKTDNTTTTTRPSSSSKEDKARNNDGTRNSGGRK
ncbi:MAG: hypothetical protein K8H86_16010 [Ignavibacteriaceae bacterium]|nr:hypothetical protein [Ignavibacteriaceae bacterium]